MATDYPVTMAIRVLRQHKVDFTPHLYTWEPRGGTRASAGHLGVEEHQVVKTLIFEDDAKRPLCILMHGDREVSAKITCEKTIAELSLIYINGGARGFLVGISPADLVRVLKPRLVEVAIV